MPTSVTRDTTVYWAAESDSTECAQRCLDKVAAGLARERQTQHFDVSKRLLMTYYGWGEGGRDTSRVQLGGEQGELAIFTHNLVRPRIAQQMALIAGQRPGIKPVATNTDAASIAQADLADGLRGYNDRTLGNPGIETDVVRGGLLAAQHWLINSWRRAKGEPYAVDAEGRIQYEGGIEVDSVPWWRCIADPLARTPEAREWVVWRKPGNRFALAAEYPAAAKYLIHSMGSDIRASYDWGAQIGADALADFVSFDVLLGDTLDTDEGVWVWEMRHLPTPALPNGRLIRFVSPDCVLFDSAAFSVRDTTVDQDGRDVDYGEASVNGDTGFRDVGYPYNPKHLHARDFCPERVIGTASGHTPARDLLGLQQGFDVATTTQMSTLNLFGRPHMWAGPEGAKGINAQQMSTGPVILETPNKPEIVNFNAQSDIVANSFEMIRGLADESANLNETVMGSPPAGMPAKAQALQRAQAVQVSGPANAEYMRLVEGNATDQLLIMKRFARTQRTAEIAGKSGAWEIKQWQKEDIAGVERFACELVDPLTQSFEGRQAQGEFLAEKGWLTKEGYLSLMATGTAKEALEGDTSRLELITQHKELLRSGIGLPPIDMAATQQALATNPQAGPVFMGGDGTYVRLDRTDPHWLTIPEYVSVLASPAARENPAIVEAVKGVYEESMRLWATLSADELMALKGPPLPSQVGMGPVSGVEPGAPSPGGGPGPAQEKGAKREESLPKPPPDPINNQSQGTESLGLPAQPLPQA